jgi:hypothetical protein
MFTLDEAFEVLHDAARHALLDAQDAGADAFRSGSFGDAQAALGCGLNDAIRRQLSADDGAEEKG